MTLVVESKDLSLPSPSQVAVAQVRDIIVPRARRLRVDIEEREDIQAAREMCRQLEAFRGYLRDRKGRDLLAAECRRTEILIGKLLGPSEWGGDRRSEEFKLLAGDLKPNDRHRFRLLAENEGLVEQLLEKGIVNRKPILQQILWQDAAESQATDENLLEGRRVKTLAELDGQKFGCIYADPPWQYGNQGTRASTNNHYETMTVEEIAALPIRDLAADASHLWLWTTNGFLFECPRIFDAWGFEFRSSYVWVKPQIGIGNYLRNSHEFLLLAIRGNLVGQAKDVRSWGEFDRGEHSAKPEAIRRDVIERVSPGPRLELFGRKDIGRGWIVWGNQEDHPLFAGK